MTDDKKTTTGSDPDSMAWTMMVHCPSCGAQPGEACRSKGPIVSVWNKIPHWARIDWYIRWKKGGTKP